MAIQDQTNNLQEQSRDRKRLRLIFLGIAVISLLFGVTIGILVISGVFRSPLANIFSIILFPILGAVFAFISWFIPLPPSESEASDTDSAHSSTLSPSINHYPKQSMSLQPLPTGDKQSTNIEERHSLPDPDIVFQFNVPLTDPAVFYGRIRTRAVLINRARKGASTSIVGPRRIGKTWLMSYLRLVASVELGARFRVVYLDATMPSCATVPGFTAKVLEELGISTPISDNDLGLDMLEKVVQELKSKNQVPLLFIDEFEGFSDQEAFDLRFFEGLRAISQAGLCLVVASKSQLIDIVGDSGKTSGFFNVFEQLTLKPFSKEEAEEFVQEKSTQAGFTDQDRSILLQYGQQLGDYWPLRLQLVGKMLLEDKNLAVMEDTNYYRPNDLRYWREFEEQLEEKYRGVGG